MTHECSKEDFLGRVAEFMENSKGLKMTMFTITIAILLQVGAFLFMWGGLTTTVNSHEKNIDKILTKLDSITFVYAKGNKGEQGIQGIVGKDGKDGKNGK